MAAGSFVPPEAAGGTRGGTAGEPTCEVDVTTRKHVQFLQRHAPYHLRRLPSDGVVVLATHPYRTLWLFSIPS